MKKTAGFVPILVAIAGAIAGCARNSDEARLAARDTSVATQGTQADSHSVERAGKRGPLPRTERRRIQIEGSSQELEFRLFDSRDSSLSVPFITYVPEDMIAETTSSDEGEAVRFVAAFGGQRNDNAFLQAFFYPSGTSEADARALARQVAASRGLESRANPNRRYRWSIVEYDFHSASGPAPQRLGGTVALGRHGNRFFHIIVQMPAEYSEGFTPRANEILEAWRWQDGDAPLARE